MFHVASHGSRQMDQGKKKVMVKINGMIRMGGKELAGVDWVQVVVECGDRVGWNREQVLCFHPADPSVVEVVTNEDVQ